MPTYDYRCAACGHTLETFQSIREPALKKCPRCKRPKLERLIGPGAGILFKGGGFYQTDYRSESYKKGESADKPSSESSSPAKEPLPKDSSPKDSSPKDSGAKAEKPAKAPRRKPA